jgi:chemotaxis family two-component system response regulator PixG
MEKLIREVKAYIDKHETGRLEIRNLKTPEKSFSLYFVLGRLIWGNGGEHSLRRLYRYLKQQIPSQIQQGLKIKEDIPKEEKATADYDFLRDLCKSDVISMKELVAIKNQIIIELLFDIFQTFTVQRTESSHENSNGGLQLVWFPKVRPDKFIAIPPHLVEQSSFDLISKAQQQWQKWEQAGLQECLPNQAPIMTDANSIKQATIGKTYENLKRLLTGKQSLRDLAVATKRDVLTVTQALWGYYQNGWLGFQKLSDFNWSAIATKHYFPSNKQSSFALASGNKKNKFLVACVDDSPQVTQTMEKILHSGGYDCFSLNDPLRASATLLKAKPDLIFLDLIMPNTNGYEICSQLRKVSSLQETPIIILTGKDGFIDRMRAKMVGANEYVSKPVQRNIILGIAQNYLLSKNLEKFSLPATSGKS